MEQKFKISQNQKQKFSSKMVPSIEILGLSQQDLETLVNSSLIDNPFSDIDQSQISLESKEVDVDYKKIRKNNEDVQNFEYADESLNDLMEYVMPQLYPFIKEKKDEEIFRTILESLDSRGFLAESSGELCKYLNIKNDKLQTYLKIIQHIEPKGLAAHDYKDCILIQLSEIKDSNLAKNIIINHLDTVAVGDFLKIAKSENRTVEEVKEAINLIQTLNPIPANGFKVKTKTIYIVPDAYILREGKEIIIEMNSKIQNKIQMNVSNYELYKSSTFDDESKEFLKKKLNDFRFLQYSVNRRTLTLKRIIEYLVKYQMDFFLSGEEKNLKSLRLIDVAEALELHCSTISRAISNKFFQCEYGTFAFHYLLPKCYSRKGKTGPSISTIKHEIMEIIKFENKEKPYTDEEICQFLEEEGFSVSRRSVTLYRKECCISSSRNRKDRKKKEG